MTTQLKPDQVLDATGLSCPMPIVKARLALKRLEPGQVLEVWASWPNSIPDFQAFIQETKQGLLEQREESGVYKHVIQKSA
jgi:tRNA 2-thiouridine synthesizing protein A